MKFFTCLIVHPKTNRRAVLSWVYALSIHAWVAAWPMPALAATHYYVASTGNDANSGTEASPFKTIAKGIKAAQSGDTVRVKAGTYPETVTLVDKSGITLQGIDSPKVTKHWIISKGAHGTIIQGITFDLAGVCNQAAITIRSGIHDVVIDSNQFYNAHLGGVSVESQTNGVHTPNERIVVRNNYFERIPTAIYIIGKQHTVEGNTVVHGTQKTEGCNFIKNLDADGVKFYGQDHVIRNNRFLHFSFYTDDSFYNPAKADPFLKDSHTDCFQTSSMSWFASNGQYRNNKTNHVRIHGNFCDAFSIKNLQAGDTTGVMFLEDAEDIYFYNNFTYALGIGGKDYVKNLHIYNNTMTMRAEAWRTLQYPGWNEDSEAQGLVHLQSQFPETVYVYNNIFYDAHHAPVLIYNAGWKSTNAAQVRNNIAYWRHGLDGDNGNTSKWHWFNCDKGNVKDALGNWCVDPEFVDIENFDFKLKKDSPALGYATTLAAEFAALPSEDFFGVARPQGAASEVGAYEFPASDSVIDDPPAACREQDRGLVYLLTNNTLAAEKTGCFIHHVLADGTPAGGTVPLKSNQTVDLAITLYPAVTDRGKPAVSLLLARVNQVWFIRDAQHNWQVFTGQFTGAPITLGTEVSTAIWRGSLFPGVFTLFAGYMVDQRIVFNGQNPISLTVEPHLP